MWLSADDAKDLHSTVLITVFSRRRPRCGLINTLLLREKGGAPGRTRTCDPLIRNLALCEFRAVHSG